MNKETKLFLFTFALCIIGITAVLSFANWIDDIIPNPIGNNAAQTQGKANGGIINSNTDCNYNNQPKRQNMGWTKNTKDTELNNQYYLINGTSSIALVTIGGRDTYELFWRQKQYSQFDTSKEAIAKFKELESQA